MRIYIISFLFFFQALMACGQSQNANNNKEVSDLDQTEKNELDTTALASEDELNFLFLGDIMSHDLQIESAYNPKTGKYDFSTEFEKIEPIIKDVDVTVGNLEVTLGGPPYKGYPQFSSPDQLAIDIKNAGIDYLVTSNNHINDRGIKGFNRTLHVLDSIGFKHTGTFRNIEEKVKRHPMVIEKKGWRVALFNYTYGINGGSYNPQMLINEVDTALIRKDIIAAKKQNFDAIIIFFHWGIEYKRNSNAEQQEIAKMCFENGANVVIGAHPHVVQEMAKYRFKSKDGAEKDVFVAYSLGNYVANYGSWRYSNGGALARFTFKKAADGEIKIENQGYYLVWVYRKAKTAKLKTYYVLPVDIYENDQTLGAEHTKLLRTFSNDSRTHLKKYNTNVNEYLFNKKTNRWEVESN